MPIRLRVTLLSTWLLAVALAIFGLVFYLQLVDSLRGEIDRRLQARAQDVARYIVERTATPTSGEGGPTVLPLIDLEAGPVDEVRAPGVFAQVVDPRGEVLTTSRNLQNVTLPVDPTWLRRALEGERATLTVPVRDRPPLRVQYEPIVARGAVVGVLQVAESLGPLDVTATRVERLLLVGGGLTISLAALVSWVVVGRALQPIAAITRSARQIRATADVGRRVPTGATRDEVGLLAETINEMLASIERTIVVQREFLADSSHELRSPLTVIRGNLDLARRAPDDQSRAECLREAEAEAARMGKIVDDLLLLARPDAELTMARQPVDLGALVQDIERRARVVANGVLLAVGRADPATVEGDPDRLRQAVSNLVDNAIRHTPSGGRVTLSAIREGGEVRVAVQDTGVGIAPEHLPRLFERFYRVDKARSRADGGSGLGLAIVKYVAEAHGGRVGVESAPGKGSTFTITLPLPDSPAS
ncbi:MAG TPA: ATP-binding protein [Chloroflexota bacterium]|nr:ATP-binding protein [Chloroflexota bacterium]